MHGALGLDFGTTNTLCAWMDGENPIIIPNDRGERATPSIVALSDKGDILVGTSAKNLSIANPDSVITGIKRLLGKKDSVKIGKLTKDPVELASKIISKAKNDAEMYLGFDVNDAVITVPARFSDPQRRAVRKAASMAGLKTIRILNEPSSAALARAWMQAKDNTEKTVLVYDFGGGTFDATVLKSHGGSCWVLSSEGDDGLGGIDIDEAMRAEAGQRFLSEFNVDIKKDPYLYRLVLDMCEKAKIELSTMDEAYVAIPFVESLNGLVHPGIKFSKSIFNNIASPFVERSIELVKKVIKEASLKPNDIDTLVLSGGSSRINLVRTMLFDLLGKKADPKINPEEIVALGASVEAARMEKRLSGLVFTDVCSRTFGLEIENDGFIPIIKKNESLPACGRRVFTTVEDYQNSVELHVLQGESSNASKNQSVGRFLLPGLKHALKEQPRIAVDFSIDEGDMLLVRAKDLDTGVEESITIFDGVCEPRPAKEKMLSLAAIIKRESESLTLDQALQSEISNLLTQSSNCQDEHEAEKIGELLEALLAELRARTLGGKK